MMPWWAWLLIGIPVGAFLTLFAMFWSWRRGW